MGVASDFAIRSVGLKDKLADKSLPQYRCIRFEEKFSSIMQ